MLYKIKKPHKIKVLVNKNNKLDKSFIPKKLIKVNDIYSIKECYLQKKACKSFEKICKDAAQKKFIIKAASCYRSYDYQKKIYKAYVEEKGKEYASICSAKPGHSEHQTGLAVDIQGSMYTYDEFATTKEFNWMQENAYKYGFILRYPSGKENITGFKYEPWHYRYVGKRLAKKLYKKELTLEEYLKGR